MYHPPKPIYDATDCTDQLFNNFHALLMANPDQVFVLTGDLNHLDTRRFESILGFEQLVQMPTHNSNILDKFLTNRPDLFDIQVVQSLIKTKHKAVVINTSKVPFVKPYVHRKKVCVNQYSPSVAKRLSEYAGGYNWRVITNAIDNNSDNIDHIYDDFLKY